MKAPEDMRPDIVRPGYFSKQVAADSRRAEFDIRNEVICVNGIAVDFIFIGDSITQRWELNAYFGGTGRCILNRGIGGDTSEFVLKRFEADVIQLKPRCCVLNAGVNDSWELEDDPWTLRVGASETTLTARTVGNLKAMIAMGETAGVQMAVCSILPTNMTFTAKNAERNRFIKAINRELKVICLAEHCIYVDFHSLMVGGDGQTLADNLTTEGIHPHVLGYNIMADVLRKTLADHGIQI